MNLPEAISLIQNEKIVSDTKSVWADLGCGSGLFTCALASLLDEESIIYAVDKNISSFKNKSSFDNAVIKPVELNLKKQPFLLKILMES